MEGGTVEHGGRDTRSHILWKGVRRRHVRPSQIGLADLRLLHKQSTESPLSATTCHGHLRRQAVSVVGVIRARRRWGIRISANRLQGLELNTKKSLSYSSFERLRPQRCITPTVSSVCVTTTLLYLASEVGLILREPLSVIELLSKMLLLICPASAWLVRFTMASHLQVAYRQRDTRGSIECPARIRLGKFLLNTINAMEPPLNSGGDLLCPFAPQT